MPKFLICFIQFSIIFKVTLSLSAGYNKACVVKPSDNCDDEKGFKCAKSGVCKCQNENEMKYNVDRDYCEVFVGGNCEGSSLTELVCRDKNAECVGGDPRRCECEHDFRESEEDAININVKCLPDNIGARCDKNLPCHATTGLKCKHGRCQCEHPLAQRMGMDSLNETRCLGIVEATNSCDPKKKEPQCSLNALCGDDKKCHCKPGWSAEFGWPPRCKIHHGEKCEMDDDSNYDPCNEDRGLKCMNGLCQCSNEPDAEFDKQKQVCAVKEGYACNFVDGAQVFGRDKSLLYLTCKTGLACVGNKNNPYFGTCVKVK